MMKNVTIPKGYCDFSSAANHVGMSRKAMKNGIKAGEIEAILTNNCYYVNANSVLAYMKANGINTDRERQAEKERKRKEAEQRNGTLPHSVVAASARNPKKKKNHGGGRKKVNESKIVEAIRQEKLKNGGGKELYVIANRSVIRALRKEGAVSEWYDVCNGNTVRHLKVCGLPLHCGDVACLEIVHCR